jgi:hypothetical protein
MPQGFLATLLSTILGAGVAAYVVGRYMEKGRQAAIKATFEEVLKQSSQRAAEEERGKRIATHEDIENVLSELRLVTKETEQIKTDVSRRAQTYLRAWEERCKLYVKLIEWTSRHIKLVVDGRRALTSKEAWDLIASSHLNVLDLSSLIVIFGSAELRLTWEHFSKGEMPAGANPKTLEWCDAEIKRVNNLQSAISVVAANDLWGKDRESRLDAYGS